MSASEDLIVRLVDEEIAELVASGNKYALFGSRASENIAARLDMDAKHIHRVWRGAKL